MGGIFPQKNTFIQKKQIHPILLRLTYSHNQFDTSTKFVYVNTRIRGSTCLDIVLRVQTKII